MSAPLLKVFVSEGRIEFWCTGCNQLLYALGAGKCARFRGLQRHHREPHMQRGEIRGH